MSTRNSKRELDKKKLYGIATGQVIGAGIIAQVNLGVAMTGKSGNLAMVLSGIRVILLNISKFFISNRAISTPSTRQPWRYLPSIKGKRRMF